MGLVPTLRTIRFQMGITPSVLGQDSSSDTNAEVPPSPKGAPSSWELCLKGSGLQGQAGLDVDPVGTTAPRALGHHCQGCKATRGTPSQPFWPAFCCKKWDVCRA